MQRILLWFHNRRRVLGLNGRNRNLVRPLNNPRALKLVGDKLSTKILLEDAGIAVSPLYGVIRSNFELTRIDFLNRLRQHKGGFVCKPACGAMGNGILIVAGPTECGFTSLSGMEIEDAALITHFKRVIGGEYSARHEQDKALVEQRLVTDHRLTELGGMSSADIRVVTVDNNPVMAMLRLPTQYSHGKANLHMGGVGVGIDLATGRTIAAECQSGPCTEHPDTGLNLIGFKMPHWQETLDVCRRAAEIVPLGCLGVDIMVDERMGPVVVELNGRPGLSIQLANMVGLPECLPPGLVNQPKAAL